MEWSERSGGLLLFPLLPRRSHSHFPRESTAARRERRREDEDDDDGDGERRGMKIITGRDPQRCFAMYDRTIKSLVTRVA